MKERIDEIMNLMSRMQLFEGKMPRVEVTRDKLIDMLNTQDERGAGKFVTFIYAKPQKFYNTKTKWRPDEVSSVLDKYSEEGNEHWYPQIKAFNSDDKIRKLNTVEGIISVTIYKKIHWTSPGSYGRAYDDYMGKLSALRMSHGIGIPTDGKLGDNLNQRQKSDYGAQFNQTGKLSKDFNLASMSLTPEVTRYVVGTDGMIKGTIPNDMIKAMTAPYKPAGVEKAVSDVLTGDELESYRSEKAELDKTFRGQNFLLDGILAIVAGVDGTSYYYLNDAAIINISEKSDIKVQPQELLKIAREQLGKAFDVVEKNTDDPVSQPVNEGRRPKNRDSHFAVNKETKKLVFSWDYHDIDGSELRQFKHDYFTVDLSDMGLDPKQYTILTDKTIRRLGIDPNDQSNWAMN